MLEDIRNRMRHPKLGVDHLHIANAAYTPTPQQGYGTLTLYLQFQLRNLGSVRAANACLKISSPDTGLSTNLSGSREFANRPAPDGAVLLELQNPMYPGISITLVPLINCDSAVTVDDGVLRVGAMQANDVRLLITIYADSAPAQEQEFILGKVDPGSHLQQIETQEYNRLQRQSMRR
jgi:hypothetical protein